MTLAQPTCPVCSAALVLGAQREFNPWTCPAGHGLAATLSEGYERAQEDELHTLWEAAKGAPAPAADARRCPMCTRAMVTVAVPYDADEVDQGLDGDGPDTGDVDVEVCVADQLIWFDAGELETLPADLPDAEPTAEQEAALAQIRADFGENLEAALEAQDDDQITERIYHRLSRNPRLLRRLTKVGNAAF
jgi:hypothetical protein